MLQFDEFILAGISPFKLRMVLGSDRTSVEMLGRHGDPESEAQNWQNIQTLAKRWGLNSQLIGN